MEGTAWQKKKRRRISDLPLYVSTKRMMTSEAARVASTSNNNSAIMGFRVTG
jgi:hypothetical protein